MAEAIDMGHIYKDEATLKQWLASIGKRDYFHPGIVVRHSTIAGYGLFASVSIKKGELISYEDVKDYLVLNRERIESLGPEDESFWWHFCYQVGDDAWFGPRSREVIKRKMTFFENHSCDPTTWFEDDITMTARRDIAEGEEITYDYSTTESYIDPEMETIVCRCGAPECRGRMLGDDWQRPELQERYGPHWMSYLRAKILDQHGLSNESAKVMSLSRRLLGVDGDPSHSREVALNIQSGFAEDLTAAEETSSTSSNEGI